MLDDYAQRRTAKASPLKYHIRGHFPKGGDKLPAKIDVDFLKRRFLTYKKKNVTHEEHVKLGLDDAALAEFLEGLSFDLKAPAFAKQFSQLLSDMRAAFTCTEALAEHFYYNNALRLIRDLATNADPVQRRVTKKQFLKRIDSAETCFDEWLARFRGKDKYLSALRKRHFTELNIPSVHRFFLIETGPGQTVATLKEMTRLIARKWSRTSKLEPQPFCPYIYFHGLPADELIGLKRELNQDGFKIIDGHDFQGADFDVESIKVHPTDVSGIKVKIINNSDSLSKTLTAIVRSRAIFQFYLEKEFFSFDSPSVPHVKIRVDEITDIKEIV
nr:DUF4297 family anti-phage-associated protein [Lysobacter antibioticus]